MDKMEGVELIEPTDFFNVLNQVKPSLQMVLSSSAIVDVTFIGPSWSFFRIS